MYVNVFCYFIFQVFIRELISNASDALEKFRYLSVSGAADAPKLDEVDRSLEIRLSTDKQNRTITIQVNPCVLFEINKVNVK